MPKEICISQRTDDAKGQVNPQKRDFRFLYTRVDLPIQRTKKRYRGDSNLY